MLEQIAIQKPLKQSAASREAMRISQRLIDSSKSDVKACLEMLDADIMGLDKAGVEERLVKFGANEVAQEKIPGWYMQLIEAFVNPFIGVLFALGVISLFTDVVLVGGEGRSYKTITVLATMIIISSGLRFWQEFRSTKAAVKLKALVTTTTAVLRAGNSRPQEIPIVELVPGDIVRLSAGDMVPADMRVLSSKDLFISQAVLTGESVPVEKFAAIVDKQWQESGAAGAFCSVNPIELDNICFMGTNIVSGSATALVVATGNETYFGSMAKDIVGRRALTSFDKGINKVSWLLIRFMLIMVPIVFLINGFTKGNWFEALMFAVSVAVGLTPEMLPMVVTANLARGAVAMAKRKTIVKRLNSIQNLGAMDILCTDKTGTLTQDKIILERHLDIHGNEDLQVLEYAYLNSYYQTGLKNLLDVAVMDYADKEGLSDFQQNHLKVDEIPFDFVRRRMSVIVKPIREDQHLLVCKGAVEEVLSLCSKIDDNGQALGGIVEFTDEMRTKIRSVTRGLNEEGLRVLAVAYKWMPEENRAYSVKDECEMVLAGYIAFLDPPKETASEAIRALKNHGVEVKIVTGDNEIVTRKICKEVGLEMKGILLGHDVEAMLDDELAEKAERTTIFAKMSPSQKSRIIRALQSLGHTVGYLGDGINDAPALRDADVGISVDTAVDIAKESADIILLKKNLMVLERGVIEGRRTFGNIIKYVKMTASSNFGNVFSVLVASAFLPFLPMLAIHLLIQNLLYDISQISIPWDRVDKEYLKKPRKWEADGIARFMICIGPISSIFDITTFCVMWFVFKADNPDMQALFQSGWFVEGLLSQTLIVHMIRTQKIPFFQSMPAAPVMLLTIIIMAIGIYIPFSPLGAHVGLVPLPIKYFKYLALTLLGYCFVTQVVKFWYIKRFKQWL